MLQFKNLSDSTYGLLESDKFILDPKQGFDFDFDISFNGSNSIQFIPVGKNTTVSIDGDWPSPVLWVVLQPRMILKKSQIRAFMQTGKCLALIDLLHKFIKMPCHILIPTILASDLSIQLMNINKTSAFRNMDSL